MALSQMSAARTQGDILRNASYKDTNPNFSIIPRALPGLETYNDPSKWGSSTGGAPPPAKTAEPPPTPITGGPDFAAGGGGPAAGTPVDTTALEALRASMTGGPQRVEGGGEATPVPIGLPPQQNPQLGQRLYPLAMRELRARVY
jgi:hypothetical protein